MRKLWAVFFCCALFPLTAWSAMGIGDFTLGMPRQQVIEILQRHFPAVTLEKNMLFEPPMPYYRALEPNRAYNLGDVPIYVVRAYFDGADRLSQLGISFNTTDAERVKTLVPLMRQAHLAPGTDEGRYEALFDDGELTYSVNNFYEWTTVEIADKRMSDLNIRMRAHDDQFARSVREKHPQLFTPSK
ncbi:hypothetical protein [Pseudomonas sp. ADAK13]|uniref:hypothetical protein n=1 Tax=Pseudomonas sp. ADAK13 TaxID=2730847 RepID=UPI001F3136A5|nr:hypothetical protein [Pseudomonas sp. ADAK13]